MTAPPHRMAAMLAMAQALSERRSGSVRIHPVRGMVPAPSMHGPRMARAWPLTTRSSKKSAKAFKSLTLLAPMIVFVEGL
jgi:hypothetical protein